MFNDDDDPEQESESDEEQIEMDKSQITINGLTIEKSNFYTFAQKIVNWEVENKDELIAAQKQGLSLLLICVMNKVFTQLHLIRTKSKTPNFEKDTIVDMVKRFEYILINAFATFLKPVPVVQQNIAWTDKLFNLRNASKLAQKDPSLRDNVVRYIGMRPSFERSKSYDPTNCDEKQKLLQIIWSHPLFELSDNLDIPTFAIGRPAKLNAEAAPLSQRKTVIQLPSEIKSWLDNHATMKRITLSESSERRKIFDAMNVFLNEHPDYEFLKISGRRWEILKSVIQNDEQNQ